MKSLNSLILNDLEEDVEIREALPKNHRHYQRHTAKEAPKVLNIQNNDFKIPIMFPKQPIVNGLSHRQKKTGSVGDTKFLGNDDSPVVDTKTPYCLTRMKSLGTIPNIVSEQVKYDPFLTPMVIRKISTSSGTVNHEIKNLRKSSTRSEDNKNNNSNNNNSSDEEICYDMIGSRLKRHPKSYINDNDDHGIIMREHNMAVDIELLKAPFERGYRRSYNYERKVKSSTPLRQSDGYFFMPQHPSLRTVKSMTSPITTTKPATLKSKSAKEIGTASLHNLPTDNSNNIIGGRIDRRYENLSKIYN